MRVLMLDSRVMLTASTDNNDSLRHDEDANGERMGIRAESREC
jgi:hypothetical protein